MILQSDHLFSTVQSITENPSDYFEFALLLHFAFLFVVLHFYYPISVNKNAKPITSQPSRDQAVKRVAVFILQPSETA